MLSVKIPLFFGALVVTVSDFEFTDIGISYNINYDAQTLQDIQVTEGELEEELNAIVSRVISQALVSYEQERYAAI